jgi:hypothetical protein
MGVQALPVLFLLTAVAAAVGAARSGRPWLDAAAILGLVAVVLGVAAWVASAVDPAVSPDQAALGVAFGAVALGGGPAIAYYVLGRLLARRPAFVFAAWFLAVLPVAMYFIFALILTTAMVGCPPHAYECPV